MLTFEEVSGPIWAVDDHRAVRAYRRTFAKSRMGIAHSCCECDDARHAVQFVESREHSC